jgi:hypothetical protein
MSKPVCMGAMLQCSFGMTPSSFMVINPLRPMIQGRLMANITDFIPMTNILPFGMCKSMSNPTVASATAAAMGALTPMPCIPVTTTPWSPGGKEMVGGSPVLMDNCKLICTWGGQITVKNPGQTTGLNAK